MLQWICFVTGFGFSRENGSWYVLLPQWICFVTGFRVFSVRFITDASCQWIASAINFFRLVDSFSTLDSVSSDSFEFRLDSDLNICFIFDRVYFRFFDASSHFVPNVALSWIFDIFVDLTVFVEISIIVDITICFDIFDVGWHFALCWQFAVCWHLGHCWHLTL